MKVSIISGIYNAEYYLEQCVHSMLCQSYKNIEIILVVNGSIDESNKIVNRLEKDNPDIIKAYYIKEKLGAGGSRQFGLKKATGEYICFVDCDDMLERDYIKKMIDVIITEPIGSVDIVISDFRKIDVNSKTLYIRKWKNEKSALIQSVAPWGKIFRKKYLNDNKMVLRNIPFGEDVIFSAEVYLTKPKVKLCNYIGYIWRNNLESTSHTELRGFPEKTFEKSKEYFEYMRIKYSDEERMIFYFMYKYYIWYLLQSGRKVLGDDMKSEYDKIFNYLHKAEIDFKLGKLFIIKEERFIVKMAMNGVRLLDKLSLARLFFVFYSQSFLGLFWPSL